MTEKDVRMSQKELIRIHVINQVLDKQIAQVAAAQKLDLSDRQIRRIVKRVRGEGNQGIIHKSRGKPGNRKIHVAVKERVINLCREKYHGFGPTFACEKLFENERIHVSDETLRGWLVKEELWLARRQRKKYRQWRERKHCFGEMVQIDGSHHRWLEDRGPLCVLMGYIDDATGKKWGRFYAYEGTVPALDSLKRYIRKNGIPQSIYVDKHSTYKSQAKQSVEEQLTDEQSMSQFERAARELGIEIIHANSPQAKGRIERSFKTDQDRLVKEMHLKGINSIKEANKFLGSYWGTHNARFSVNPAQGKNLHRMVPQGLRLDEILCVKTSRTVRNDFTIVHNKKLYQVLDKTLARKVAVENKLNGRMYLVYRGRRLRYKDITGKQSQKEPVKERITKSMWRPSMDHPFKEASFIRQQALSAVRVNNENSLLLKT